MTNYDYEEPTPTWVEATARKMAEAANDEYFLAFEAGHLAGLGKDWHFMECVDAFVEWCADPENILMHERLKAWEARGGGGGGGGLGTTSATARRCRACIVAWPSGTKCADHQDPDARSTSDATDSPIVHATHAKQKMADRIAEDVAKYAAQGASKESLKPRIQRLFHDAIVEAHMAGREYERARCPDYPTAAEELADIEVVEERKALLAIANAAQAYHEACGHDLDGAASKCDPVCDAWKAWRALVTSPKRGEG